MAMKKCKECGTEISSSAKVCPNCGKDQRNFFMKHKVISFILVLFILGIVAGVTGGNDNNNSNTVETSSSNTEKVIEEPIEYMTIDVDTLKDALETNAAAAKDTYNGKYLEITGKLGVIDSDLKYIGLYSATDSWDLTGVHCTIKNEEQKDIIKTLSKDDIIVVKGKINDVGEVLGYRLDITEISK